MSYARPLLAALLIFGIPQGSVEGEATGTLSDTSSYVFSVCPVSGQALGAMGEPAVKTVDGREVRFCCKSCIAKFEGNAEAEQAKIDHKIIATQQSSYPLNTCPVMGGPLDGMGKPVDHVYGNRLVRFCCKGCIQAFEKDPAKYIAILDEAVVATQGPNYPLDTCPVSGKKLEENAVDMVIANRLLRLCCAGCADAVKENPAKYLAKLEEGAREP